MFDFRGSTVFVKRTGLIVWLMTTNFRARNIFNSLLETSHVCISLFFFFGITCSNCYSAAIFFILTVVEIRVRNTAHVDLLALSYGGFIGGKVPCTVLWGLQYHVH